MKKDKISRENKEANDKKWYKDKIDNLLALKYNNSFEERRRIQVNYNLYNNQLDEEDFKYITKPFGFDDMDLPQKLVNRDIISTKINALLGMERTKSNTWHVLAVNPEAVTRKEKEEFGQIQQYVISQFSHETEDHETEKLMQPALPKEVKRYMKRNHSDVAEVAYQQLLNYLNIEYATANKFSSTFKHGLMSAKEIMYVGCTKDKPIFKDVNTLWFDYGKSPDSPFIQDGEWAICEYVWSLTDIVSFFHDELTDKQIDDLYEMETATTYNNLFFDDYDLYVPEEDHSSGHIRVHHVVFKGLRKIGYLDYIDENGLPLSTIVDEEYRMDEAHGDIKLEWHWIPEVYEGWKIKDIYLKMRPVQGQIKNIDNLYECKLPYYGVVYDNVNSKAVSIMDRLKHYQYLFNIIMYKLEQLIYSDRGKKLLMNIKAVPNSDEIDFKKWQYFFEANNISWYNNDDDPKAPGMSTERQVAQVLDLGLTSQIDYYIRLGEHIRNLVARISVSEQMEGQIAQREAVQNVNRVLAQNSMTLDPIFTLHNEYKKQALMALIETAKIVWKDKEQLKLSYILDDMTKEYITVDMGLLQHNVIGLYLDNYSEKKQQEAEFIQQATQAALQNGTMEMSEVIHIIRTDDLVEAEELLRVAEDERKERQQQELEAQSQQKQQELQLQKEMLELGHRFKIEEIITKEEERRKTEVAKMHLLGASYNPDTDLDKNKENDFYERYQKENYRKKAKDVKKT